MRPIKELAQAALAAQNACNIRAVARGLVRATDDLHAHGVCGSDELMAHPVTRAWVDKLASLAGIQNIGNHRAIGALDTCEKLANSND
jgi:hypothetical protein